MELSALERMTRLLELTAALSKTMTRNQVADVVIHMGLSALGARSGALLTVDGERSEYVLLERGDDLAGLAGSPTHAVRLPLESEVPIVTLNRFSPMHATGSSISVSTCACFAGDSLRRL